MSDRSREDKLATDDDTSSTSSNNYSALELQKLHAQQQQILMEHFSQAQIKMALAQERQRQMLQMQMKLEYEQNLAREECQKASVLKKVEELKKKNKDKESAEASSAVKEILRKKIESKQKEKTGLGNSPIRNQQWGQTYHSSLEQQSPPNAHGSSPPYSKGTHFYGPYDDLNHPLRKTLSEPLMSKHPSSLNMKERRCSPLIARRQKMSPLCNNNRSSEPNLKVRLALKQKMLERRSSPLLQQRRERLKRTNPISIEAFPNSNPDSGPNSPHSSQVSTDSTPGSCEEAVNNTLTQQLNKMISLPDMSRALPHMPPPTLSNTHDNKYAHSYPMPYMSGYIPQSYLPLYNAHGDHVPVELTELVRIQQQYAAAIAAASQNKGSFSLNRTASAPIPVPNTVTGDKLSAKQQLQNKLLHKSKELRSSTEDEDDVIIVSSPKLTNTHSDDQPLSLVTNSKNTPFKNCSPSSPLVQTQASSGSSGTDEKCIVGLAFDEAMLQHDCQCHDIERHPENPIRLKEIWKRLSTIGLLDKCKRVNCPKASMVELQTCHSEPYSLLYGSIGPSRNHLDKMMLLTSHKFYTLSCGGLGVDPDTVWNDEWTPTAARVAAGGAITLAHKIANSELSNGFALVRPPGHHAEPTRPMGFCYFNNIAIAAKSLLDRIKCKRIMIVDWDVHHGNSTQSIFYADSRVLYLSLHRHDNGNFFPGTGSPTECGIDMGTGFNINIAFSGNLNPPMGDAEYLAAFRSIVLPVALSFEPEIILVSAGFDGTRGHPGPLGGYQLSPSLFGWMTNQLKQFASGKLVMVLEGGYELQPTIDSVEQCVKALLGENISPLDIGEMQRKPTLAAVVALQEVILLQQQYWPILESNLKYIDMTHAEWCEDGDTVSALASQAASLSMAQRHSCERSSSFNSDSSEPMEEM